MPTVKEIVKEYLEKNGYDGLYKGRGPMRIGRPQGPFIGNGACGCLTDNLNPCGEPFDECKPGYRGACTGLECDGDCDWHIYGDKADALRADEERAAAEKEHSPLSPAPPQDASGDGSGD